MKKVVIIAGIITLSWLAVSGIPAYCAGGKFLAANENQTIRTQDPIEKNEIPISGQYESYTSQGDSFTIAIPLNWKKIEKDHPYGDLTRISGIRLIGPKNKDGAPITISVLFYGGDGIFATDEAFIRNQLNSIVRIDYDKQAVIHDTTIAGRVAKQFQIETFELIYLPAWDPPPMKEGLVYEIAQPSKKVAMARQFIVVPARKGFYVLNYTAPEDIMERYKKVFEKVAASFEPRLP